MTTTKHRSKTKPPLALAAQPGEVLRLPLAALVRHPDNRSPLPDRVAEIAASIDAHDQLEPLVVRTLPDGHPHREVAVDGSPIAAGELAYQILSGETRALAQLRRGETAVACRLRPGCDDAEALRLLAEFNAARSDLNPIEKARLIQRLCQPVTDGGAGLTREAAGRIYGLGSSAGASNLVRLLELPEPLVRFVAAGSLPQSFARAVLPLCGVPAIVDAVCELVGRWADDGPPSRDDWLGELDQLIAKHTREWEPATKNDRQPWSLPWCKRRLFTTKEDLGLIEVTLRGQTTQRVTNVTRWDALQEAARTALKTKNEKPASRAHAPKSAKQIAATEAEQDQQLTRRIARWRHAWLRQLIADKLKQKVPDHWVLVKLVLWMLTQEFGYSEHCQLRVGDRLQELVGEKTMRNASTTGVLVLGQSALTWQLVSDLVRSMLSMDEKNPDMPVWRTELVERVAADLEIDLADSWLVLQTRAAGSDEPSKTRLLEFLGLHNSRQLQTLAGQWGMYIENQPTKAAMVKVLGSGAKIHKLPKCLAPGKRGGK